LSSATFAIAIRFNATPRAEPYVPEPVLSDYGLEADPGVPGLFEGQGLQPERLAALLGELAESVRSPAAEGVVASGLLDDVWISIRRDA
jgi:hypothetical protein